MFTMPVASVSIVMNTTSLSPTVISATCIFIFGEIPLTVTGSVASIDLWFLSGVVITFIVYVASDKLDTVILLPSTLMIASLWSMIVTFSKSIVQPSQVATVEPSSSYANRISLLKITFESILLTVIPAVPITEVWFSSGVVFTFKV